MKQSYTRHEKLGNYQPHVRDGCSMFMVCAAFFPHKGLPLQCKIYCMVCKNSYMLPTWPTISEKFLGKQHDHSVKKLLISCNDSIVLIKREDMTLHTTWIVFLEVWKGFWTPYFRGKFIAIY